MSLCRLSLFTNGHILIASGRVPNTNKIVFISFSIYIYTINLKHTYSSLIQKYDKLPNTKKFQKVTDILIKSMAIILNIELDKFTPYLLLTDLLQLVLEVKSDGTLYEGTSKINFWKNFRSDNIRGEIFLENVNLSKHQLLQSIPFAGVIEGGYLNVKNYDLKLDKNEGGYYLSYLGGDFSINDLNITRNLTIPSSLSGIIFDITIPKINFSQISSVYKYKNDTAYINNFIIKSDDFNISSKNCEFNTIKNRFSNCEIVFNFSDKGLKDFSSWLVFLGNIKFEANKDYHLELMGLNYRLINEI